MSLATRGSRRRLLAGAGAALISLLSTPGCTVPGRPPALYRLGLVAPFEGFFAATGYEALEAVRARVQEWNGHLREAGLQVQVWAVDDSNDEEQAILRARELAADPHLLAVVGHFTPTTSSAAAPIYLGSGLLQVSPVAMNTLDTPDSTGLALSVAASPSEMASLIGNEVAGALADKSPEPTLVWLSVTPEGALAAVDDCRLPSLVRRLTTSSRPPQKVILPLGYCPAGLASAFPAVTFQAVTGNAGDSAGALAAAAADLALAAIAQARHRPSRAAVVVAARAEAQASGRRYLGGVYYPPPQTPRLQTCLPE
ncbi:MAG: ABC transporter substrate-binding protein [Anaerolineae bacterium]|jgi:hypothetical protein